MTLAARLIVALIHDVIDQHQALRHIWNRQIDDGTDWIQQRLADLDRQLAVYDNYASEAEEAEL